MHPHCKGQLIGRRANKTKREGETSIVSYTLVSVAVTIFHSNKDYEFEQKLMGSSQIGRSKH